MEDEDGDPECRMDIGTRDGRRLLTDEQVLAVDLLNPAPASEARKHKLKVRRHDIPTTPKNTQKPVRETNL